ncbi:MAG: hypothetical protein NC357_04600 [Bacteroides sp.]|nr:hypothetical protein [Bacteroides sp.]
MSSRIRLSKVRNQCRNAMSRIEYGRPQKESLTAEELKAYTVLQKWDAVCKNVERWLRGL